MENMENMENKKKMENVGESPVVINATISDSLRSAVNITTHQHFHAQHICPVCGKNVRDEEDYFSCVHCHRGPVHERCGDMGLTLCRACLETLETQERRRERCAPLLLSAATGNETLGNETLSFFLFAKSPLQMGRAKRKSLKEVPRLPGRSYIPRDNDIVARVFGVAGKLSEEASLCISQRHVALRVLEVNGRECLKACDCGTDGMGSTCGTWVDGGVLPKAQWVDLPDSCELCLGKSADFIHRGLTLEVTVYRATQDKNQIDCVRIDRKDVLSTHRYVLVYRTAYLGLGECALSLRKNAPTFPWGKILYDEDASSFIYEAFPQSPLASNSPSPCRLSPETVIAGGEIEISVRDVLETSEKMFAPGGIIKAMAEISWGTEKVNIARRLNAEERASFKPDRPGNVGVIVKNGFAIPTARVSIVFRVKVLTLDQQEIEGKGSVWLSSILNEETTSEELQKMGGLFAREEVNLSDIMNQLSVDFLSRVFQPLVEGVRCEEIRGNVRLLEDVEQLAREELGELLLNWGLWIDRISVAWDFSEEEKARLARQVLEHSFEEEKRTLQNRQDLQELQLKAELEEKGRRAALDAELAQQRHAIELERKKAKSELDLREFETIQEAKRERMKAQQNTDDPLTTAPRTVTVNALNAGGSAAGFHPAGRTCPHCGQPVEQNWDICPFCAKTLNSIR
jgi:endogenous inhibitor of DNA gyrase (YacG/DUF329 family)